MRFGVVVHRVSLLGCSPEGSVCSWPNATTSPAVAQQTPIDVGDGFVYSVISFPVRKCSRCLVTSSLGSIWVVNPPGKSEVLWVLIVRGWKRACT